MLNKKKLIFRQSHGLFHGKCRATLQNRALLVKMFYRNGVSTPETMRTLKALKNIFSGAMNANEHFQKLRTAFSRHALKISKNFLRELLNMPFCDFKRYLIVMANTLNIICLGKQILQCKNQ